MIVITGSSRGGTHDVLQANNLRISSAVLQKRESRQLQSSRRFSSHPQDLLVETNGFITLKGLSGFAGLTPFTVRACTTKTNRLSGNLISNISPINEYER